MSNFFKRTKHAWEENEYDKIHGKFSNGGQTPAYGNEKTASQMIIELQNKNATLRLALGKLTQLCKNTRMQEQDEIWAHYIGVAIEAMSETDPNGKWDGIRL
jgi:hypothetical protein